MRAREHHRDAARLRRLPPRWSRSTGKPLVVEGASGVAQVIRRDLVWVVHAPGPRLTLLSVELLSTSPKGAEVSQVVLHAAGSAIIAAQGLSVLALWLRLRWRVRAEQVHRQYLVAIVRILPAGSTIKERRADGSSFTLNLVRHNAREERDG
jgi:hypothetical protein